MLCNFLAPQGGEHRYNLFLAAHDAGQEEHVVLRFGGEGAADGIVAADVEKPGALEKDVGEHEDDDVVAVIGLHAAHLTEEFLAALEHFRRVKSRDLTDAEYLSGEVELLEVGADKLGYGLCVGRAGKQLLSQGLK